MDQIDSPDTDQQDHDFFDILYQQFSHTTAAETSYWMPRKITVGPDILWEVYAVEQEGDREELFVATFNSEEDADFVCGLHGALPDLIRRLHESIDKAERMDTARDQAEEVAAEAVLENLALQEQIAELERQLNV